MRRSAWGSASLYLYDEEEGLRALRARLALALQAGVSFTTLRGYVNLSDVLEFTGQHTEAAQVAREGLALGLRDGHGPDTGVLPHRQPGRAAAPAGPLGRGGRALVAGPGGRAGRGVRRHLVPRASRRGLHERPLRRRRPPTCGPRARRWGRPATCSSSCRWRTSRRSLALAGGDLDAARASVRACLTDEAAVWSARYTWPLVWVGLRDRGGSGRAGPGPPRGCPGGQPPAAADPRRADTRPGRADPAGPGLPGAVRRRAAARAEGGTETQPWSAAVAAWEEAAEPYPLGYAWLRLAEAQSALGDRQAAARSVAQAHAIASQAGAGPIAAEAAALARRARLSLDDAPAQEPNAPAQELEDELAQFGLTDREREVLLLLAHGRSNPEIAQAVSSARKRPACTCLTSWPSWESAAGWKPPRCCTGWGAPAAKTPGTCG